jgi:hypothetical protein
MTTDTPATPAAPTTQLPRTDLTTFVISFAVAGLALLGLVPVGMDADQLLALGAGLAAIGSFVRALWERRAEINRKTVLENAQNAAELFRLRLADVRARHASDQVRLEAVAHLATRAADPKDPTQITPKGVLDLLHAIDPDADTAPIDTPPPLPPAA